MDFCHQWKVSNLKKDEEGGDVARMCSDSKCVQILG